MVVDISYSTGNHSSHIVCDCSHARRFAGSDYFLTHFNSFSDNVGLRIAGMSHRLRQV